MFHIAKFAAAILTLSIAAALPAHTNADEKRQYVTTYLNATGQRLTVGYELSEWTRPIDGLASQKTLEIASQNNVCVSLIETKQLKSAKTFCQRALDLATLDIRDRLDESSRTGSFAMLAAISSNLGVVNALTGNESTAAENFNEARWLDPEQEASRHNMLMLGAHRSSNAAL